MIKTFALAATIAVLPTVAMAEVTGPTVTGTRLDIVAQGSVKRVPDVAIISAGVMTTARDAKSAMASNATAMARVLTALRGAGVADRDLATAQISLNAQYRYIENQAPIVTGYQANNSVTVRFRDIARSGAILDALVAAGANQINGPTLTLDKPETAQDEARANAIKTARARAELYAKAANLTVKRIVAISEAGNVSGPMPMDYARGMVAQTSAKSEIVPGEQDVGVTINVTFELG